MKSADKFSTAERSAIMRAIKSKNTTPELRVRKLVHAMGYRYRLHRKDLPGAPDLAFPGRRKAIFVHGCFWHGHECARGARAPKNNAEYWATKISRNKKRDSQSLEQLFHMDWSVLALWECELRDEAKLKARLIAFLDEPSLNIG